MDGKCRGCLGGTAFPASLRNPCLATGCGDADPWDQVVQCRRLSEIEACFRANRLDLRIRPVFHWRDRWTRAHIAICYMAFCCPKHPRHCLTAQGHSMRLDRIRRAPNELEISVLHERNGNRKSRMPSPPTEDAERISETQPLKAGIHEITSGRNGETLTVTRPGSNRQEASGIWNYPDFGAKGFFSDCDRR